MCDAMISLRFVSVFHAHTKDHACRQQEIFTALRKTWEHEAFAELHLMVKKKRSFLKALRTHGVALSPKVKRIVELHRMPLNRDFIEYASRELRNRWVLASNDDVYPEGLAWSNPPPSALLLSRHAKSNETTACGWCDATKAQLSQSLCNTHNFGSFDAWVAKFERFPLNSVGLQLSETPRHAFGADNLLGHVFETYFGKPLQNRCLSYRLYHIHCTFATSVSNPAIAKRGYGDGTFVHHGHMADLLRRYDKNLSETRANKIVRRRWAVMW